jgi:hypothetical protein
MVQTMYSLIEKSLKAKESSMNGNLSNSLSCDSIYNSTSKNLSASEDHNCFSFLDKNQLHNSRENENLLSSMINCSNIGSAFVGGRNDFGVSSNCSISIITCNVPLPMSFYRSPFVSNIVFGQMSSLSAVANHRGQLTAADPRRYKSFLITGLPGGVEAAIELIRKTLKLKNIP